MEWGVWWRKLYQRGVWYMNFHQQGAWGREPYYFEVTATENSVSEEEIVEENENQWTMVLVGSIVEVEENECLNVVEGKKRKES